MFLNGILNVFINAFRNKQKKDWEEEPFDINQ